jgi:sugar lactone lactonase YvrE
MKLEDLEAKLGIANMGEEEKLALVKDIQANIPALKAEQRVLEAKTQANLVVEAIKKIKESLEARFDELNGIVDVKVRDITSGKDGLQGPKGDQGDRGFDGVNGKDGYNGKDGLNGVDGKDGVGVQDAYIDFDGSLIIKLTDGTEINVGEVVPMDVAEKIKIIGNGGGTSQSVLDAIDAITNGTTSLTAVNIPTNSGTSTVTKGTGITSWIYSGNSFSVTAQEATPNGLFFKPDGTAMYVVGASNDRVNQYSLSTPWNVSTASFVNFISVSAQDSSSQDVFFKPDGLTMYVVGDTNNTIFQYTLSSAWGITTATYASKSFSVATQDVTPFGIWFKPDGLIMYVVGATNDSIFQYTLSVAWDVSTAAYANKSFVTTTQEGTPTQVNLNAAGTTMWILGTAEDYLWEYTLGTAWDISTAVVVNGIYLGFLEANTQGLFIDSSASNRVYVLGSGNDTVFQYNTATNSLAVTTDNIYTNGQAYIKDGIVTNGNSYVKGNFTVNGSTVLSTTTVSGTLTATSTLSLTGTTTSSASFATAQTTTNTSICTAQTSGTFTLGGTSGTGTMTLGRSTVSQTTDFQAGATASGSTKAINIGTAGLSGSTTNIAIGSAVSGATSTTTMNGLVVNSISAAVSAAGSAQGTATALVSNINNVTVVAAAADGVRLPTAVAGMRILVRNTDAADTLKIYPATGGQINALGSNAAYSLTAGLTVELIATTATQWYTF